MAIDEDHSPPPQTDSPVEKSNVVTITGEEYKKPTSPVWDVLESHAARIRNHEKDRVNFCIGAFISIGIDADGRQMTVVSYITDSNKIPISSMPEVVKIELNNQILLSRLEEYE